MVRKRAFFPGGARAPRPGRKAAARPPSEIFGGRQLAGTTLPPRTATPHHYRREKEKALTLETNARNPALSETRDAGQRRTNGQRSHHTGLLAKVSLPVWR